MANIEKKSISSKNRGVKKQCNISHDSIWNNDNMIKTYFSELVKLSSKGDKFPVDLDEVWPLVYSEKGTAVKALKRLFINDIDYKLLEQNIKQNKQGGHNEMTYKLSLSCFEYFIVRKVRPVFEVYRRIFYERVAEEKNPDLIVDRAVETYTKKGLSPEWITKRLNGKGVRNEFTSVLRRHGVGGKNGEGFRLCTNAMYEVLWGMDAKGIRIKKDLPEKANIRENMSLLELQTVSFTETLAMEDIQSNKRYGNEECEKSSRKAAIVVKNSINQFRSQSK